MEVICSAVMGELVSRTISFLVDKYLKQTTAPTEEERLHSLQRLLLRLCIIIEEAEERRITNQAMLHQLCILKMEMYRGYYILDSFSCRAHGEERMNDHQVSHSFAPSKFNPAKRVCFCRGSSQSASQAELLEQVLGSIGNTIEDVSEFVILLNRCPRLYRQPYNMYLLLDKCMFGRHMELEYIINFLLQAETTLGAENPGVLPIIGPGKVGKSTLIEHACNNERVRSHFSQILCFGGDDLRDASAVTLRDAGIIKHQNLTMGSGRTLIIIELVLDIDERLWKRLFSSAKRSIASGSKIIIASRSDKIASFGSTQALRVQSLTQEAYWYFFKVRIFGCMNAQDHPKLAAIAMDIARELNGCFMGATIFRGLLKSNFNPHFWSMALACLRKFKRHNMLVYGERFAAPWQIEEPIYVRRLEKTSSEYIVILDDYQTESAKSSANSPTSSGQSKPEAPKMSVQDLFFGSVRPQGKFNVLAWTSHLPPHYNYMFTCGIQRPRRKVTRKKCFLKNGN